MSQQELVRFPARLQPELHKNLVAYSEKNGISINTAINNLLEFSLGYDNILPNLINKTKGYEEVIQKLLPHTNPEYAAFNEKDNYVAVRGRVGNTTQNCSNLIEYISMIDCIQIVLFATSSKPENGFSRNDGPETNLPLMGAIAIVELEGFNVYVIFDGLFLTAQRYPRYKEVREILDIAVASNKAYFICQPVPFTSSWGPVGAVDQLIHLPRQELSAETRKSFFSLLCSIPEESYENSHR
ncbi:hypothetical protein [uncultured Acinetobacter sp.]|uniref:toxin-antitoxin system HicB family antitoxin n=1 Tax=uncultured Acinetobacter sp. TaxID=165433 RepID=UPI00258772F1|nr:hypothetical protein [uncultured Acinetobacter sp.]